MASFTTPRTWAVGDVLTAADMNTFNRDNITDLDERLDLIESTAGAAVATNETTAATSPTDLATSGPAVTLTTGTSALVIVAGTIKSDTALASAFMGFAISGATTLAAAASRAMRLGDNTQYQRAAFLYRATLTAGSNTFPAKYWVSGGTGNFVDRQITVVPIGD